VPPDGTPFPAVVAVAALPVMLIGHVPVAFVPSIAAAPTVLYEIVFAAEPLNVVPDTAPEPELLNVAALATEAALPVVLIGHVPVAFEPHLAAAPTVEKSTVIAEEPSNVVPGVAPFDVLNVAFCVVVPAPVAAQTKDDPFHVNTVPAVFGGTTKPVVDGPVWKTNSFAAPPVIPEDEADAPLIEIGQVPVAPAPDVDGAPTVL
jgi:hypothetical protein